MGVLHPLIIVKMKRSKLTDGRAFQDDLVRTCKEYQAMGVLRMRKVDPPMRVMGGGAARRVIFTENPFPDFIGAWTERGGRMVAFEAKSTKEPRLEVGGAGGLNETQLRNLRHWQQAGAVTFVLWEWRGHGVILLGTQGLLGLSQKHIKWGFPLRHAVPPGTGFILHDFLALMRYLWP
jgi:penicillin-binding protein-related factor A (putative recombinase)